MKNIFAYSKFYRLLFGPMTVNGVPHALKVHDQMRKQCLITCSCQRQLSNAVIGSSGA